MRIILDRLACAMEDLATHGKFNNYQKRTIEARRH